MRIGISSEFMGVKWNGAATYSRNLLQGLAEVKEHQFIPYLSSKAALPLVPQVAHISPQLVYPYNAFIRLPVTLPIELMRHPVDLLHSQGWGPPWAPCPMLLTIHDIGWETNPQFYPKALALRLSYLVRSSAHRAVRVITSSHATAKDVVRLYGVSADKIRVVYPAIDPVFAPITDQATLQNVRSRYNIAGPYILYVGSIEPKKNVARLIHAYATVRRQHNIQHKLVLVGKALWLSQQILDIHKSLGLEQEVLFTGQVPQEDLTALYSGADAFAFLGWYEGFGYPPLEAMACGTPVLAANRASLPEVLGDAALLVDPFDQEEIVRGLARLLKEGDLRNKQRARGMERAQLFQVAAHARQVVAVYEECLEPARQTNIAGRPGRL